MAACYVCTTILIFGWSYVALVSVLYVDFASSSVAITTMVFVIAIVGFVDLRFECVDCLK